MGVVQTASGIVGNIQNQKIISQLSNIDTKLGMVTTLSWFNLGISAISLGVTVVGMRVLSEKMNEQRNELSKISKNNNEILNNNESNKNDTINQDITNNTITNTNNNNHYIDQNINNLIEEETRHFNEKYSILVGKMCNMIDDLIEKDYSDYYDSNAKELIIECACFLENDLIDRFLKRSQILVTMDQIITFFSIFNSLYKTYLFKSYFNKKVLIHNTVSEIYENKVKLMCSNNIIKELQFQASNATKSVLLQSELNSIEVGYKVSVAEQIKMIKASEWIMKNQSYDELEKANYELEKIVGELKNSNNSISKSQDSFEDYAFLQYDE